MNKYLLLRPKDSATLSIRFSPITSNKAAERVEITHASAGSTSPMIVELIGNKSFVPDAPEINIKQDAIDIPCTTGTFDFGTIQVGQSSQEIEFTIENLGLEILELTGNPDKIIKIGGESEMFVIEQTMTNSAITYVSPTIFTITFTPTSVGLKTTYISIANNDTDENPYTFTITGFGKGGKSDFNGDGYQDVIVGAFLDDDGGIDSGSAYIFFGSENWVTSIDASNADVKLIGEDAGDYFGYWVSGN